MEDVDVDVGCEGIQTVTQDVKIIEKLHRTIAMLGICSLMLFIFEFCVAARRRQSDSAYRGEH